MSAIRKVVLSTYFLAGVGLFVISFLPLTMLPEDILHRVWWRQLIMYIFWLFSFFFILKLLVPQFLYRNKISLFIFIILAVLFGSLFLNKGLYHYIKIEPLKPRHPKDKDEFHLVDLSVVLMTMFVSSVAILIAVIQKMHKDEQRENAVESQRVASELAFLKSQINPHFFFNVLHTIYGLTDMDTEKAKESIYTLSHMMRYVLYDTANDITTLKKEIDFIENYNMLMRLRLPDKVQVVFDRPSSVPELSIAPMLFLPFIENAYKHGISYQHASYIYIEISCYGSIVEFEIRNSVFAEQAADKEASNGIGLVNTRRRLDLLYPKKHELVVKDDLVDNEFYVNLKIACV